MRIYIVLTIALLSIYAVADAKADLLDCNEKKLPSLADIPLIGPKIASEENHSGEHDVRDFFKNIGCQIKKGATKVGEQAKKLGVELKEGAKKFGEKAKVLGSDIKVKFYDFKERLSTKDSSEEEAHHRLLANVELINPDVLKAEQECGHGHILDALGNCRRLRK